MSTRSLAPGPLTATTTASLRVPRARIADRQEKPSQTEDNRTSERQAEDRTAPRLPLELERNRERGRLVR
jgi:hypothetical protein